MACRPPFYGIRTPPFMPYEPFLLGVGVVFNLLNRGLLGPPGPKPRKSLKKMSPGASSRVWKKSRKGLLPDSRLETGIGGVKSPKIRGGVKFLNFQGPLKLTPFYRDFYRKSPIWGSKSPNLRVITFGASSPPSSVRYVLTPPIPVSD